MRNRMIIWLLLGGGVLSLFLVTMVVLVLTLGRAGGGSEFGFGDRIQVVEIEGVIVESRSIIDQLKQYEDSPSVPAILLNINSPGGGVAPSQELYAEIKRLREDKGKVIVAYISSVGASGAYYIACATDLIIANPGTLVGSIGVIAEWLNYDALLDWAKLSNVVFKSGEFKDVPSATRDLTSSEQDYYQALIDDVYTQFLEAVAEGRGLDIDLVREFADGRVFTGRAARDLSMIDATGNLQYAVDMTADLAGISGTPRLLESRRERVTLLDVITGDISDVLPFGKGATGSQMRMQYIWKQLW
jgi:protease-4